MKDNLVQFLRKYKIAFCVGITCVLMIAACTFCLHGSITSQAADADRTAKVLQMLSGKQHPYIYINDEYIEQLQTMKDNPYYKVENGILIDTRTNTTILIPPKMEKVVIPQGVEHVDNYAAGARSYSEYAIYENKYESDYNKIRRYKTLSIPDSVKTIKDAAFNGAV